MTEKPAIYSLGRAHEWLDVADNLGQTLGWTPKYWITVDLNHEEVGQRFPNAERHNFVDLNRCIPAAGFADCPWQNLDGSLLDEFRDCEQVALELMDRMDLGGTFTHWQRQRAYLWLLSYWISVIKAVKPHVVVFNAPPHSPGEFVLHSVCRERGINVRVFLPTQICSLHLVSDGLDRLPDALTKNYVARLTAGNSTLSPATRKEIDAIAADDGKKQWYVIDTQEREQKKQKLKKSIQAAQSRGEMLDDRISLKPAEVPKRLWAKKPDPERSERQSQPIRRVYKRPDQPLSDEVLTRGEYSRYLQWAYPKKIRLESTYRELAEECSLDDPFIFFAMHYQPERTTCPDGGRFNNQFLAASMIANALPNGWKLYVKEHPGQYTFHNNGDQSRDPEIYRDLAALPNTTLVSMDQPTDAIVRRATAVATITGFIGWEALAREIPVMVFGAAWYRECRGVHKIKSHEDIHRAIQGIQNGDRHSLSDVLAYAGALEDTGRVCYSNTSLAKGADLTREKQIESLTQLLLNFEVEEKD